jgi:hypothetical protein
VRQRKYSRTLILYKKMKLMLHALVRVVCHSRKVIEYSLYENAAVNHLQLPSKRDVQSRIMRRLARIVPFNRSTTDAPSSFLVHRGLVFCFVSLLDCIPINRSIPRYPKSKEKQSQWSNAKNMKSTNTKSFNKKHNYAFQYKQFDKKINKEKKNLKQQCYIFQF